MVPLPWEVHSLGKGQFFSTKLLHNDTLFIDGLKKLK